MKDLECVPVNREFLKNIYKYMKYAVKDFMDADNPYWIHSYNIFTDDEINEVRLALKRKRI